MPTVRALALSTHPGPSLAVTGIAVILGFGVGLEPWRLVVLGLAIFFNQASVGLSNDWIDADRDRAVGRTDKPVAQGLVSVATARLAAFVAAGLAIVLTLPLGAPATLAHTVVLVSAWGYNIGLKSTPLSVLPYIVSFGLLPLIVTFARPEPAIASAWALAAGGLLGVSAHFANVLPDLADDAATGVRGLPHRVGARTSGLIIAGALAAASVCLVVGLGGTGAIQFAGLGICLALAAVCAMLVVTGRAPHLIFRLIIVAAIVDVLLLAFSGDRILA